MIGEAEDPLAELYNNNQSDSGDGSGSSSTGAGATGDGNKDSASSKDAEYQRLLDTGDGVMVPSAFQRFLWICRSTMARRSRRLRPVRGICMAVVCRWVARIRMR